MTTGFHDDVDRFQGMLEMAMEAFETTGEALRGTVNRLKAEEPVSADEVGKRVRDMNAALLQVLSLEGKARDATGQRIGQIGAGQLDLDAARAEIGVRLACLRAAGGGGDVSGGAE